MSSKSRQDFLSKDDHPRLNRSKSSSYIPIDYHHSKVIQKKCHYTTPRKKKNTNFEA